MAIQEAHNISYRRNERRKATNLQTGAVLKIWSGDEALANCAAADLFRLQRIFWFRMPLPGSPFSASNGALNIVGVWNGNASNTGTATFHRIYDSGGNCAIQGDVTTDLILNNTSISTGQAVTVTQYTLTAGNQR